MDTETEKLPRYLEPLIRPTPSSVAKLLAAWDGLLVETQIDILSRLTNHDGYLRRKVQARALTSETPYIRYLAAKLLFLDTGLPEDMETKARIEADSDPLVRYSNEEGKAFDNPEKFWALPHEARLARIRLPNLGGGRGMAEIASYALDNLITDGRISENELEQVLDDYLLRPEFLSFYQQDHPYIYEGTAGEIEALWHLVPKLSPRLANRLIKILPPEVGWRWRSDCLPQEIIGVLTDEQLKSLLYRPDIDLRDLRRDLFRSAGKDRDNVRSAAISSHFSIEDSEFAEILALPDQERFDALADLAATAGDLRLCVYEALQNYLYELWNVASDLFEIKEPLDRAEQSYERRIAIIRSGRAPWSGELEVHEELHQLRLYRLARQAVPVDKGRGYLPDDELEFLAKHVVEGDTWATFMAFEAQWRSIPRTNELEKYLPRIDGIDADFDEGTVDDPTA